MAVTLLTVASKQFHRIIVRTDHDKQFEVRDSLSGQVFDGTGHIIVYNFKSTLNFYFGQSSTCFSSFKVLNQVI